MNPVFVISSENTKSAPHVSKSINATVPYLFIIILGLLVCTGIQIKYNYNINSLKQNFAKKIQLETGVLTDQIEMQFQMLYQGLKTIARLPSIKQVYMGENHQQSAAQHDTQELYNFLYPFTQLSEIYVVPKAFDPDQIDPETNLNYQPSFTLDKVIVGKTADHTLTNSNTSNFEEIEIFKYREMAQHLNWLRKNASNENNFTNANYPALISKEVITGGNTYYSLSDTDNSNRNGMIYSVPFYSPNGQLAGSIVGVILSNNLRKLLPKDNYVLYNASSDFKVANQNSNNLHSSFPWIKNGESNPNHKLANNIKLTLPDAQGDWRLWVASRDAEFLQSSQVLSAKQFSIAAQLATLLLTVCLGIIIYMQVKQRRFAESQNVVLEHKVTQRTNELAEQKKTLSQHYLALEKSEAKFSTVLAYAAESIIIIGKNGLIETFNKAAEYTFGYTTEEIVGQPIGILLPSLANKPPSHYLDKYRGLATAKSTNKQHELLGVHKNNSTFFAELHLNELSFSDMKVYTCIVRDISAYKMAEQATKAAKEEAEQSSRTKSEFLANMSHELRTPLNAIIGYCELLIDETKHSGNLEYHSDLNNIHTSGYHLLNLINSILDLSKIEAGKMELFLEHFDIKTVIEEAVINTQPLVVKNNNNIVLDISNELGLMYADTTKIQQIIINLLGNANKFTKNGQISVYAEQIKQRSINWLQLMVTDTGIGMSQEQLDNLFTEFTQGDSSTTKKYGGTGLGLAITLQFCEMMGGTIKANSDVGLGSHFVVQLPMAVIGDNVDPKQVRFNNEDEYGATRSKISRVMVIGDNKQSTALISSFLLREGFYVDLAHSVSQALSIAEDTPPDLIIVDENSVQMNELFDINAIKQSEELKDIPLVMLTKSENEDLASAIGVKDFLPKPIQRNRILDVVFKYVRKQPSINTSDNYILVVEDEPNNREVIRRHLESDGLKVKLAANGLEGLAVVKEKKPDLIFLDIVMPEMDGFEFVENLRSNEQWQSIPVIILTAIELSKEQRAKLNNHVETILFKTDIEPAAMLGKLRNLIVSHLNS